jgi:alkaline phosphatase D
MATMTRRDFARLVGAGFGAVVVSSGLGACSGGRPGSFEHGVASGDPLTDRVILWTRVTPEVEDAAVSVMWEVATDEAFSDVVVMDEATTDATSDYTLKVDVTGLAAGTTYFYRFTSGDNVSDTGITKTLPEDAVDQVRFVVLSCSNFPAGYFHVYAEAAATEDVDAVLHLGDYLYEYAPGEYASADAEALGRVVEPASEILSLDDYRARYAQHRSDPDLQELHRTLPFIAVWDDHEVANDTWKDGAQNHQEDEGSFSERRLAALQAYAEWMPLRPPVDTDIASLQRNFRFGDLVNLVMLDTRQVGRDQPLDFADYVNAANLVDRDAFFADIDNSNRTMLGTAQREWLLGQLSDDEATWQVLVGQQVLMGQMYLPAAVVPRDLSDADSAPLSFDTFLRLGQAALLQPGVNADDPTLTPEDIAYYEANEAELFANIAQMLEPNVPYNLDAWDGYGAERTTLLEAAAAAGVNLVVLAGDTHNAWANNLELEDGTAVGVEFATASVSSPGLEDFLGLTATDDPEAAAAAFEAGVPQLITRLKYSNLLERGLMTVTFTATEVTANWRFVSTIKSAEYTMLDARETTLTVAVGSNTIA